MNRLEPVTRSRWRIILGLVCLTAAALAARLIFPGRSPMGLHIDEASNAWNAWCILHTLRDEHGQQLPFFYTEAFGDFRSPLYLYFLIPFQAIFGLSEFTTRLPAVFAGTACVPLIYYVGLRFGKVHMLMDWALIRPAMQQELPRHRLSRIIFILRPGDLPAFGDKRPDRVMTIHSPDGRESLIVYDYLMAI